MRGRLIFPFLAEIAQLDTIATSLDPDQGGPETSGYDNVFGEVVKLPTANKQGGSSARKEATPIALPCQVESDISEQQMQLLSGNAGQFLFRLVFHYRDLETLGLVDPETGIPVIGINDRITRLLTCDGELVRTYPLTKGGAFITHALDRSFGLMGARRNLLVCTIQEREQGTNI